MTYEERAFLAGAVPPLTLLGEGAEGVVFRDANGLAYKVGRHVGTGLSLADEAELMRLLGETDVRAHVPAFVDYVHDLDVLVREAVEGRRVPWAEEDAAFAVFARITQRAAQLDYAGVERKLANMLRTPDGRFVVFDLGMVFPVGARGVRAVRARLQDPQPMTPAEGVDLALTIRSLAVHDPQALSLSEGLRLLDRLEARTGQQYPMRADFESDLRRERERT